MIANAIHEDGGKTTSVKAIDSYISENYDVKKNYASYIKSALQRGIAKKIFKKVSKEHFSLTKEGRKKVKLPGTPQKKRDANQKIRPKLRQKIPQLSPITERPTEKRLRKKRKRQNLKRKFL